MIKGRKGRRRWKHNRKIWREILEKKVGKEKADKNGMKGREGEFERREEGKGVEER